MFFAGKWIIVSLCLTSLVGFAEEIVTLDGTKYENVSNVRAMADGLSFSVNSKALVGIVKVPYADLPDEVREKYKYDPFEDGLRLAKANRPIDLSMDLGFRLAKLEDAKKKAKEEKKMLGFVMVWDSFFRKGRYPMGKGSDHALAHFYTAFNKGLVLVFVRHEDELNKVPESVKKGFFGPEEGGFAPNMAVVNEDCSKFICEIPMGGKDSDGKIREEIFRKKIEDIKRFMEIQAARAAARPQKN